MLSIVPQSHESSNHAVCGAALILGPASLLHTASVYLALHTFNLNILRVDLIPHVQGHALQVPHDAAHVGQVFLHLVLAGVISHPVGQRSKVRRVVTMICVWPAVQMMTASFTCQSALKEAKETKQQLPPFIKGSVALGSKPAQL